MSDQPTVVGHHFQPMRPLDTLHREVSYFRAGCGLDNRVLQAGSTSRIPGLELGSTPLSVAGYSTAGAELANRKKMVRRLGVAGLWAVTCTAVGF